MKNLHFYLLVAVLGFSCNNGNGNLFCDPDLESNYRSNYKETVEVCSANKVLGASCPIQEPVSSIIEDNSTIDNNLK